MARWPIAVVLCAAALAAGDAKLTFEGVPAPIAASFRMYAAQALQPRHPEQARQLVEATFVSLRPMAAGDIPFDVIRALAEVAPDDAVEGLASKGPGVKQILITSLAHSKPQAAATLFQESVAATTFEKLEPIDAWQLLNTAQAVSSAAPRAAADVYERILKMASATDYGANARSSVSAIYQVGPTRVTTATSRESLLLGAAAKLKSLAPDRLAPFRAVLSQWDISSTVTLGGLTTRTGGATTAKSAEDPEVVAAIRKSIGQFRGLPTDEDRAKLALEVAAKIRSLPGGGNKLSMASGLCGVATEGDLGKEALSAAASVLGQALRETKSDARNWMELANLVRYEHVAAPFADPELDAANEILTLREKLLEENTFSLAGMDGKRYSLADLRGKVVLLNFWATWCPPCRKEMPDMEKLHQRFGKQGLVVLAVSDEARETVAKFLEKQSYTFPVLLDPDRKVNDAYAIEGIPKSFLFDREGKIVARAIDMRTERQFLEMFKAAGLE